MDSQQIGWRNREGDLDVDWMEKASLKLNDVLEPSFEKSNGEHSGRANPDLILDT